MNIPFCERLTSSLFEIQNLREEEESVLDFRGPRITTTWGGRACARARYPVNCAALWECRLPRRKYADSAGGLKFDLALFNHSEIAGNLRGDRR